MRRTLLLATLVLALPGGAAQAATSPVNPVDRPPLTARLTACTTGLAPAARAATFTASMPALAGTRRMTVRFRLLQRRGPKGAYKRVDLPEWAADERSQPGRPGFIFTKRVEGLLAPASYKAAVRFRWYDAKGRLQRQVSRTTGPCRQPDPRPDLVAGDLTVTPRDADTALYELVVSNTGRSAADQFAVELTIGDLIQPPILLGPLAPGTADRGRLVGPRCRPGDTIRIELDADGTVDEAHEADDVVVRPCPLPA